MDRTERFHRILKLIGQRTVVPFADIQSMLEVSRATVTRDLTYLRDRLNAPIVFDHERGGYCLAPSQAGRQYALPGLWFNDREILALLTMHRLLVDLDSGGILAPHVQPLVDRLDALLGTANGSSAEIMKRVRLIPAQNRPVQPRHFEEIGTALVQRRRLDLGYFTRSRDEHTQREVSPQRLVHYRNAWYLDAWCHKTGSLRVFSLDAVDAARLVERRARDVSISEVERVLGSGYGIYRGRKLRWAVLQFTAEAARWVRAEVWHPDQKCRDLEDGAYELKVPYAATPELEMDVLRHGEHVEVIDPPELRARIAQRLEDARTRYQAP